MCSYFQYFFMCLLTVNRGSHQRSWRFFGSGQGPMMCLAHQKNPLRGLQESLMKEKIWHCEMSCEDTEACYYNWEARARLSEHISGITLLWLSKRACARVLKSLSAMVVSPRHWPNSTHHTRHENALLPQLFGFINVNLCVVCPCK